MVAVSLLNRSCHAPVGSTLAEQPIGDTRSLILIAVLLGIPVAAAADSHSAAVLTAAGHRPDCLRAAGLAASGQSASCSA